MDITSVLNVLRVSLHIAGVAAAIVLPAAFVLWAIRPVMRLPRENPRRTQFTIGDVLALFLMIQAPLSVIVALLPNRDPHIIAAADIGVTLVSLYFWFRGVQYVSRLGIESAARRFVYLGLLLPVAIAAAFVLQYAAILTTFGWDPFHAAIGLAAAGLLAVCGSASRLLIRPVHTSRSAACDEQ
jgi:hypothetical protein